ncbi:MAG TPA: NAD(P)-dependent oxidoreductase [Vicinamibacterales bacterium]|nr:NAD(P)-dependent oxidoreductase [Vicinamibacterales bacterium]
MSGTVEGPVARDTAVLCLRPEADFARVDAMPPASLRVSYRSPSDADVGDLLRQSRAMVIPAVGPKISPSIFEGSDLALVQITGAGVERLDRAALTRLGIPVANVPGGSNSAVAEYVVTMASLLLRRFAWADWEMRRGNYEGFRARLLADNLAGLDGLLAGVIGLGVIGRAVAETFHRAGCRVCYYDPDPKDARGVDGLGARRVSLEELLATADVISLHVPLQRETERLIGPRELSLTKPGVVLIQASRGGVVDEAALAEWLQSGHIGGAAIDVYAIEPPVPNNPLLRLEGEPARRLIFTPHIAGVTRQSASFLLRAAWQNVERVLVRHEPPLNRVY